MTQHFRCDSPDCRNIALWFVGREFNRLDGEYSRGHTSCSMHLADACLVTLNQLQVEGEMEAVLSVRPAFRIDVVIL